MRKVKQVPQSQFPTLILTTSLNSVLKKKIRMVQLFLLKLMRVSNTAKALKAAIDEQNFGLRTNLNGSSVSIEPLSEKLPILSLLFPAQA